MSPRTTFLVRNLATAKAPGHACLAQATAAGAGDFVNGSRAFPVDEFVDLDEPSLFEPSHLNGQISAAQLRTIEQKHEIGFLDRGEVRQQQQPCRIVYEQHQFVSEHQPYSLWC